MIVKVQLIDLIAELRLSPKGVEPVMSGSSDEMAGRIHVFPCLIIVIEKGFASLDFSLCIQEDSGFSVYLTAHRPHVLF